jgi:TPR repeat protein
MPTAAEKATLDQGRALERTDAKRAIALYEQAVKMKKNGHAARRLAEIYDKGIPGVRRDYVATLEWGKIAEDLGVKYWDCPCRGMPYRG